MRAFHWYFVVAFALFLSACRTAYYTANTINTPLLSKKWDSEVAVSTQFAIDRFSYKKAVNVQSVVATTKYLAVLSNFSYYKDQQNDAMHRCRYVDLGVGGYLPLLEQKGKPDEMLFSVSGFGGFSFGDIRHEATQNSFSTLRFNKFFTQLGLVFLENTQHDLSFRVGAGIRINQMNFYSGKLYGSGVGTEYFTVFNKIDKLRTIYTKELCCNLGANISGYNVFVGLNIGNTDGMHSLNFNQNSLTMGVAFDICKVYLDLAK